MNKGIRTEAVPDADYEPEEVELSQQDERFIELSKQRAMRKSRIALDVKVAPHKDVRRFSARLFSDILEPGVVATLVEALEVEDDDLKLAVLDSLACLGELGKGLEDLALEPVLDEVMLGEMAIRRLAVRCLGWIDGDQSTEQLLALVDDANLHVRQEAIRSLGVKGDECEVLVEALKDDYSGVRMTAAKALASRPDGETIKQLVTLSLGFDGMHRYDLVKLFKQLDVAEAAELYLKVLEDEDSKRVWRVAIDVLGELFATPEQTPVSLAA
jgi:HEAT repeat protein